MIIIMILLTELNCFYLKFVMWAQPDHPYVLGRLCFMACMGAVALRLVNSFHPVLLRTVPLKLYFQRSVWLSIRNFKRNRSISMDMYLNCNHRSHDLLQVWLGDCYDAFSGTDFTSIKYDRSMTNLGSIPGSYLGIRMWPHLVII